LLVQACGLALAVPPLAAAPFFGLEHSPVGGASLGTDADGRLLIFNIGSSGEDGVAISGGGIRGHSIDMDFGDAGVLDSGLAVFVFWPQEIAAPGMRIAEANGGSAVVGLVDQGFAPSCVTVTLLDDGQVVDSLEFSGVLPADLVGGDLGADPLTDEPLSLNFTKLTWTYEARLGLPNDSLLQITSSAAGPINADEILISVHGLPPASSTSGEIRVLGANLPGGTLAIAGESLVVPAAYGNAEGFAETTYSASLVEGATLEGLVGPDLCAGCLECCDPPGGDPMSQQAGWRATQSDTGRVRLKLRLLRPFPETPPAEFRTHGLDMDDDGDGIELLATGEFAGVPGHELGSFSMLRVGGGVLLDADYSPVGTDQVRLVVRNNGAPVGFVDVVAGTGAPIGEIFPQGSAVRVSKCGKLGGLGQPPCFVMCTEEPVLLVAGGQALLGDDIRILAMNTAGELGAIESFSMVTDGIPEFVAAPTGDVDHDGRPDIVVAGGARVAELGDADAEPTPQGGLFVSNLGSSGEDGVAFDLGRGEGLSFRFGNAERLEPGIAYLFGVGSRTQGKHKKDTYVWKVEEGTLFVMPPAGPGAVSPVECRVDLYALDGSSVGSFMMDELSPGGLSGLPGVPLRVRGLDAVSPRVWAGDCTPDFEPAEAVRLLIDDGLGGPIAVSDPSGVSHPGVNEIVLTRRDGLGGNKKYFTGHVTIMKQRTADPGTPTIEIDGIGTIAFGLPHRSVGGIGVQGETCDEGNARRLRTCCLGSSGEDGVEVLFRNWAPERFDLPCDPAPTGEVVGLEMQLADGGAVRDFGVQACFLQLPGVQDACYDLKVKNTTPTSARVLAGLAGAPQFTSVSVFVLDDQGGVLAEEHGLAFGEVATIDAAPGTTIGWPASAGVLDKFTADALEGFFDFAAPIPPSVSLPSGVTVPAAGGLRVCAVVPGGVTPPEILGLASVRVTGAGDPGSDAWFDIVGENLIRADSTPPCPADLAAPFGVLDLADINAFIASFLSQSGPADIDGNGIYELVDINLFVTSFLAGCP